ADEYAYVAPDPLNPDIIYGGRVLKFNKKTGQTQYVGPENLRSGQHRVLRTMPLLFHPANPKMLLFATNKLWKTLDGGYHWEIISPDLSRDKPDVPDNIGVFKSPELNEMARRGVIYSVGPSPLDADLIWAGTDDGLIHITKDGGKSWSNVTPPTLRSWDKISQIDASHFDKNTVYISVNAFRLDDLNPYIYKTKDSGKTWTLITKGISKDPVNVVREDPKQAGLLFAGTENEVFFSADDGDNWQSLRLNMPATSIRDLVVKENDLVIGTHGRSIWILDDIAPLREIKKAINNDFLYKPSQAFRVRWNMFSDTPLPPEEPTGKNPPDGAIIDYNLGENAKLVTIEISDVQGNLIRKFSSADVTEKLDTNTLGYPTYWFRPAQKVQTAKGPHRFVWDVRYAPPKGTQRGYAIAAVYKNTPAGPDGPFVHPGSFKVKINIDGFVMEKTLDVKMDPRVSISEDDLNLQSKYALICYQAYHKLQDIRESLDEKIKSGNLSVDTITALKRKRGSGSPGGGDILYGSINETSNEKETVVGLQEKFLFMLHVLQSADARPTPQSILAIEKMEATMKYLASN
ncbi:MAG: WD40/YVTN/BNR-like repeat-containing protein, partial [Bacteroidota bacterium]